jgi:hypothetical protein
MIKSAIFNAINFSDDFSRESKYFDTFLQRNQSILSTATAYLSFYFEPDEMPEAEPTGTIYFSNAKGTVLFSRPADHVIELEDGYIYFFSLSTLTAIPDHFYVKFSDSDEIIYSEKCRYVATADLYKENILTIIASNNDDRYGYVSTYPACGFFEFSEFNCRLFGNQKTIYNYSFGRQKILSSENFIKTRLTFVNLSMYQQNLLKTLCNCENVSINGVNYYLVSDFTELNKSEDNEICDLQAEFARVDQSFFMDGSNSMPGNLKPKDLFFR